jgi:hypothetical protein
MREMSPRYLLTNLDLICTQKLFAVYEHAKNEFAQGIGDTL